MKPIALPADKDFGLFIIFVLIGLMLLSIWAQWHVQLLIALSTLCLASIAVTIVKPSALRPLNRYWMLLGWSIGRLINPLILSILFFILLTPFAAILRLFGRDILRLKKDNFSSNFQPKSEVTDFTNQF